MIILIENDFYVTILYAWREMMKVSWFLSVLCACTNIQYLGSYWNVRNWLKFIRSFTMMHTIDCNESSVLNDPLWMMSGYSDRIILHIAQQDKWSFETEEKFLWLCKHGKKHGK